ncbi:dna-directed rna polymerase i rpa12 [Cryptosporidium felis]|nr:dna-directed rna polymerase i rpa12 [Cryptosporidium felis]
MSKNNNFCKETRDKLFNNIEKNDVSTQLINIESYILKDLMHSFIYTEDINDARQKNTDLPKFQYSFLKGDNFNSRFSGGCPNCGSIFDFIFVMDNSNNREPSQEMKGYRYLKCKICRHKYSSLPNQNTMDSSLDSISFNTERYSKCTFIAGIRQSLSFRESNKWWMKLNDCNKKVKIPYKANKSNSIIRVLDAMHKKKAPKIQEICPECSHNEAFFTQFQARSADEGTTVMYECCRCQHRRVINN